MQRFCNRTVWNYCSTWHSAITSKNKARLRFDDICGKKFDIFILKYKLSFEPYLKSFAIDFICYEFSKMIKNAFLGSFNSVFLWKSDVMIGHFILRIKIQRTINYKKLLVFFPDRKMMQACVISSSIIKKNLSYLNMLSVNLYLTQGNIEMLLCCLLFFSKRK